MAKHKSSQQGSGGSSSSGSTKSRHSTANHTVDLKREGSSSASLIPQATISNPIPSLPQRQHSNPISRSQPQHNPYIDPLSADVPLTGNPQTLYNPYTNPCNTSQPLPSTPATMPAPSRSSSSGSHSSSNMTPFIPIQPVATNATMSTNSPVSPVSSIRTHQSSHHDHPPPRFSARSVSGPSSAAASIRSSVVSVFDDSASISSKKMDQVIQKPKDDAEIERMFIELMVWTCPFFS